MIVPFPGAAFGAAADGDGRRDPDARQHLSAELGISADWAWARQVHGTRVGIATGGGDQGEADALVTTTPHTPVAVGTADCVPVVLGGPGGAAVIHAGWRGAAAGVVEATLAAVAAQGVALERAAIGPAIGPCCYEVGPEVAGRFPHHQARTSWNAPSIDLECFVASRLEGLQVWRAATCTRCDPRFNSHRRDGTPFRQVAVAWLPSG